jgi:AraC-like DNA-binding protein
MLEMPENFRDSTRMSGGDPFSDILELTTPEKIVSGGFSAGGAWAVRFPQMGKTKFFAIVKGACWLCIEGESPRSACAGDVFLLSTQGPFVLASDPAVPPIDAIALFNAADRGFPQLGDGGDCTFIGGFVRLDPQSRMLMGDVLPPLIHVQAAAPQAAVLQWLLDQFVRERATELPGAHLASSRLAQLMFVQILRVHLETSDAGTASWLRALGNPRIAPAIRLMHDNPGHAWQLDELARAVAMSRTTFASHFKAATGVAPLAYLTAWRMRLAERALREEKTQVAELAHTLGYASESAFSNAFKRVTGLAPLHYRAAARASS